MPKPPIFTLLRAPGDRWWEITANPFANCQFAKIELRHHTASQLGQLLRELREIAVATLDI
jgi:hypothetical protein